MKLRFLIFETKAPGWVSEARSEYIAKISAFIPLECKSLKSPSADREQAETKRRQEAEILLDEIDDKDLVILFDEKGRIGKSSEDFADHLRRVVESGKQRVVFCIGGAYGFSDEVYRRADLKWSLSPLTLNHWLAQLAALEQIYRGFTILRGLPYHNR